MLDGLLGRGFASKCKSLIKLIKNRIDVIRKKRNATQKFLKKDIADLLANGLDINAFGRTEGLLAELNVSFCYDFVEQCCDSVVKCLSTMQRISGCPIDCREVVSSLMFAAARFSDLPELRDLRNIFYEKYGNSLEHFENQEFVEKLSSKPATLEKKVLLLQDIASEFSISWDSQAFQQRMSKPSISVQDQPKKNGSFSVYKPINAKDTIPDDGKHDNSYNDRRACASDGRWSRNGREDTTVESIGPSFQPKLAPSSYGFKPRNGREESILKTDDHGISFQRKQEVIGRKHEDWNGKEDAVLKTTRGSSSTHGKRMESADGISKLHGCRENAVPERESKENSPYEKPAISPSYMGQQVKSDRMDLLDAYSHGGQYINVNLKKVQDDEITKLKTFYNSALPPPYVKSKDASVRSKDRRHGSNLGSSPLDYDGTGAPTDPSVQIKAIFADRSEKQFGSHLHEHVKEIGGTRRVDDHDDEKDCNYKYDGAGNPIPKPRSVRRRHHKSKPGSDDVSNVGDVDVIKRRSRSRRRDDSRRGLQILFDDEQCEKDEEERKMDKLLMYYSTKPSDFDPGLLKRKSKSRHVHHGISKAGEAPQIPNRDVPEMSGMVPLPSRSISLPKEEMTPKPTKVFTRAASFQADGSSEARHVHPKLPDYDDLAARFAALKGR